MKKLILALGLGGSMAFFAACSTAGTAPGMLYTGNTTPGTATSASGSSKEGTATCKNILGLVALGDCSIDTAAKAGGITQIKSADAKNFGILGLYSTTTVVVKGN
ncbi:TRL-like family protein [Helicobacter sp. MIT 21-1697]|uniref:TRL-like family protein n=1 Tax=Helicobacter sp. MIT 21-1697 TaxID=2993733 RepID=UPI00224A8E9B|nr:TRL-like family protein [Helicobacter sp. MIT 21-1697]MCX2717511.1 TRL-like family protein [Helicobacter sp. MIT 21-1697]